MYNKTHTIEVKQKLSVFNTGRKRTFESKLKQSKMSTGENNSNAKLNNETVLNIRNDYENGYSINKISLIYNMKRQCIWKIVHRYTWKHI